MADSPPAASKSPLKKRSRRSGVVLPEHPNWRGRLGARVLAALARAVDLTLHYELADPANARAVMHAGPVIFAIWHNRLALSLTLYERYIRREQPHRRLAAMVSASRDGGLLARALQLFDVQPVRGSSSRRGAQALLEMTSWAERGYDLAITPDGPRGPCYVVQDGVVDVASLTGLAIVPVSFSVSRRIELRSWDRFIVPLPFARCSVRFAEPLTVPRGLSDEQRELLRGELQQRLLSITGP